MQLPHAGKMGAQRFDHDRGQHRGSILLSLPASHHDLVDRRHLLAAQHDGQPKRLFRSNDGLYLTDWDLKDLLV